MKPLFPLVLILGAVVFSGCKSSPVDDYTEFVEDEMKRLMGSHPELIIDSNYKLDVQQTESLVSPLLGECTLSATTTYEGTPKDGEAFAFDLELKLDLTHAYQDEKWVLTAGTVGIVGAEVLRGNSFVRRSVNNLVGGQPIPITNSKELDANFTVLVEMWATD